MRVLVLGAGGFIGRRIVAALERRIGAANIVAGVRRHTDIDPAIEQRLIDANDLASVRSASGDINCIVNSVMGSDQAILSSARNVAQLVHDGAVGRAVHLSSIAVHGVKDGAIREADPLGSPADGYAAAKIAAEIAFTELAGSRGVILRPGLVHGPGSTLWTLRIGRLLASGRLGSLGAQGEGICNLVDVEDVADAAAAACVEDVAPGRAFALVASPAPTWNAYFADLAAAIGVPFRPISLRRVAVERAAAYPITALRRPAGKLGITMPEAITPGLARLFPVRTEFESSAVGTLLPDWRDYQDSVQRSAAWLSTR